jgi:hypothetical protein
MDPYTVKELNPNCIYDRMKQIKVIFLEETVALFTKISHMNKYINLLYSQRDLLA